MEGQQRARSFGLCQQGNEGKMFYKMECLTVLKNTPGESLSDLKVGSILIVIPVSVNIAFL